MSYLTKFVDVILSGFWVIPKIASPNSSMSIHDIINYSTSISPFEFEKCGKEGNKLQKFENVKNKKSFLNKIKIFHGFLRATIWWKNENLIKNSRHKL